MMTMEHKMTVRPQPTKEELQAIVALESNKDFKAFCTYLANRAVATAVLSTTQTGDQCLWTQGRSQELTDLSSMIKKARDTYDTLRGK